MRGRHNHTGGKASDTEPGYLFHVQKPERAQPGPASAEGAEGPDGPRRQPAQGINLRMLGTTVAGMALFLIIALYASVKTWQMKESRAVRGLSGAAPGSSSRGRSAGGYRSGSATNALVLSTSDEEAVRQAQILARQADALAASGSAAKAAALYEQALRTWPFLTEARVNLGRLCLRTRDFGKAQTALQRAFEDNPALPGLANDLGAAHFHLKNFARAAKLFEAAVLADPTFAAGYFNLTLCHLATSDRERAREALDEYLRLKPNDPLGLKEKAVLRAAEGDYAGALDLLGTALKQAPNLPPLLFDAAATAALMGNTVDAIMYLKKAQAVTSPLAVYLVYQQPAFGEVRASEPGKMYQKFLADDARKEVGRGTADLQAQITVEPIVSEAVP